MERFFGSTSNDVRYILASIGCHILALLIFLGWGTITQLFASSPADPATAKPETVTEIVYTGPSSGAAVQPALLPTLDQELDLFADGDLSSALKPKLFAEMGDRTSRGSGSDEQGEMDLELPPMPQDPAITIQGDNSAGNANRDKEIDEQQKREQFANYFLMGMLIQKYQRDWKVIYGDRLPRRDFILDITHNNSQVISARFMPRQTSGIPELDKLIINYLTKSEDISLGPLAGSPDQLLMTVNLYE